MIVSVHSRDDVRKMRPLANKRNIYARFMMNGCPWCVKSQGAWDSMCEQMKFKLSPQDAIVEIESAFADEFKRLIEPQRGIKLPIEGYPTTMMIKPREVSKVQGRDLVSHMNALKLADSVTLAKSRMKRKQKRRTYKRVR